MVGKEGRKCNERNGMGGGDSQWSYAAVGEK